MRYALTFENDEIFQHFGKSPAFLIVDIEEGIITKRSLVDVNVHGHSNRVRLLEDIHVQVLLCGGIGEGAKLALVDANIELISGAKGNVEIVLNALIDGVLEDNPRGKCSHHKENVEI